MRDFEAALARTAAETETYLTTVLEQRGAAPARLAQAMRHGALAGGKRVRPFLVLESAKLFGVTDRTAQIVAAALECIHCYSLVHDDLPAMDNDVLRRGKPTVWKAYDDWTAILAGDGLLTLAFELIADPNNAIAAAAKVRLMHGLAVASGWQGMVGGQAIDLEADKLGQPANPDEAHVRQLQAMKTGALIRYGAMTGGLLADAEADDLDALETYGTAIGLAFQIADDLLDAEGDEATVGKAVGKDADAGKATLLGLMGLDAARAACAEAHATAVDSLTRFGPEADNLRALADFIVSRKY